MSDATQRTSDSLSIEQVIAQRDEAIDMLADWCLRVDKIGTGWDDWDEGYKNAMYRPCGIRALIDEAKKKLEPQYER